MQDNYRKQGFLDEIYKKVIHSNFHQTQYIPQQPNRTSNTIYHNLTFSIFEPVFSDQSLIDANKNLPNKNTNDVYNETIDTFQLYKKDIDDHDFILQKFHLTYSYLYYYYVANSNNDLLDDNSLPIKRGINQLTCSYKNLPENIIKGSQAYAFKFYKSETDFVTQHTHDLATYQKISFFQNKLSIKGNFECIYDFITYDHKSDKDQIVNSSDIDKVQPIGNGATSKIYKIIDKKTQEIYAAKIIKKTKFYYKPSLNRVFFKELLAMRVLSHPNIPIYYETYETNDSIVIVEELLDGMYFEGMSHFYNNKNLAQIKLENTSNSSSSSENVVPLINTMSYQEKICFSRELIDVTQYLQSKCFLHRDISPDNIMYVRINNQSNHWGKNTGENIFRSRFKLKLIDFGSGEWANCLVINYFAGTACYVDPKMIESVKADKWVYYGPETDGYSVGTILYYLFVGEPAYTMPYDKSRFVYKEDLLELNLNKKIDFDEQSDGVIDEGGKKIIVGLLQREIKDRLGLEEALESEFFGKGVL